MTDNIKPIRPGIEPTVDVEREMRAQIDEKIDQFIKNFGHAPTSCAIVFDSDAGYVVGYYSRGESNPRHFLAYAGALLSEKATRS